ncbi:MAG: hypothetical protein RLZZ347_252 [Candidatus Parcubacteria bacterium]|jgi:hypothetical protein
MRKTLCGYNGEGVIVTPAQITAIHRELPWLRRYVPEYISVRIQRADLEVFRSEPGAVFYTCDGEWVYERVFLVDQDGALLYEVGKYQNPPLWRRLLGFFDPDLLRKEETLEDVLKDLMLGPPNIRLAPVSCYIVACFLWADGGSAMVYKPKKPATSLIQALEIALERERQDFEAEVAQAKQELRGEESCEFDYVI